MKLKMSTVFAAAVIGALFVVSFQSAAADDWERFDDGSMGRVTRFYGKDGAAIPAYLRKPAGRGPFPVVLMLHGGGASESGTYALGRSIRHPTADFIAAGWAVFAIDFRPGTSRGKIAEVEWDDTKAALELVRGFPFIDRDRVAMIGGSHGANVLSRMASRVDVRCAVLCAPAGIDLAAAARFVRDGGKVNANLKRMMSRMEEQYDGKLLENPEVFDPLSPLPEVHKVRFPLLIINGRNDPASPMPIVQSYVEKLRAANKEVETYFPENGPHGFYFGRPEIPETEEAAQRAVAFIHKQFSKERETTPKKRDVQDVYIRSSDGAHLLSVLSKPAGNGPFPALILIHGGNGGTPPERLHAYARGEGGWMIVDELKKRDWIIVIAGYRNRAMFGREDDDIYALLEYLRTRPDVDPERIGCFGGSHGGLLAIRLARRAGDELACAGMGAPAPVDREMFLFGDLSQPPLSELSEASRKSIARHQSRMVSPATFGLPDHTPIEFVRALIRRNNPLDYAAELQCPLLFVQGKQDTSVPYFLTMELVEKLRELGKQVETHIAEKGEHGFYWGVPAGRTKMEDLPDYEEARPIILDFYDRHLGGAGAYGKSRIEKMITRDPSAVAAGTQFVDPSDINRDSVVALEVAGEERSPEKNVTANNAVAADGPAPARANALSRLELDWVDPETDAPSATQYKTFQSKTIGGEISYLIYLPPQYETNADQRFPVLYWLHGTGGRQSRGAEVVKRLDQAIRDGEVPPMIVVLVNGLRAATMYCDSKDGRWPLETVIIHDLIPHVDATYRTIAERETRAVEGFSMGGFGAAHLGFKYPDVFGVVSILAPALLTGKDLTSSEPHGRWPEHFSFVFDEDLELYQANNPFQLAAKNAGKLRGRSIIRLVPHDEAGKWLIPRCDELHRVLEEHKIPHEYDPRRDVNTHNYVLLYDALDEKALGFYAKAFAR